jgi:hypothetical protein
VFFLYLKAVGKSDVSKNGKHVQEAACSPSGSNLHKTVYSTPEVTSTQLGTPEVAAHSEVTQAKGHHNNTQSQYSKRSAFSGTETTKENRKYFR